MHKVIFLLLLLLGASVGNGGDIKNKNQPKAEQPAAIKNSSSAKTDKLVLFGFRKSAPLLDGKLDDACWKNTQTAMGFCRLGEAEPAEPAEPDTLVKMCYDSSNLYFGIAVAETGKKQLKADKDAPWNGDCIELFFESGTGGKSMYHIVADCSGNVYTGMNTDGSERKIDLPVKAATSVTPQGWCLEIAVAFDALKTGEPKDNTRWKFNVVRTRRAGNHEPVYSSWALLDSFIQFEKFGSLAFYANPEIEGDLAFWENSKRSGLMDRSEVSGVKIAGEAAGKGTLPTLWDYSPLIKREPPAKTWNMRGLTAGTREKYPSMHRAATLLNTLLIDKSFADETLNELYRGGIDNARFGEFSDLSHKIDCRLNLIYQMYGQAFSKNRDKMPDALFAEMEQTASAIRDLKNDYSKELAVLHDKAKTESAGWDALNLELAANAKPLNSFGYNRRFIFAAHEFSYNVDSLMQLGPFSTQTLGLNFFVSSPKQKDANSPWDYSLLQNGLTELKKSPIKRTYAQLSFGLHDLGMIMLPELKNKPGIYMSSADNLPPYTKGGNGQERATNIHSQAVNDFIKKYLKETLAEINKGGMPVDFFLFAWEGKNTFQVVTKDNRKENRSMGFTPEGKESFRSYLKERYSSIADLNARWQASYKSFDEIEPLNDKYIKRPAKLTGLCFEHERWTRVTYLRWFRGIKDLLHEYAPGVPVMADMSYFLIDGNLYLAFKENCADIMSFHTEPKRELPMWNFMNSINRRFGKLLGYYENYWPMFTRKYMSDERLAKREADKFFFELFMNNITISGWWMRYTPHPGTYLASYNHNPYYLEYDQTVFRWSTTILPVMFQKGLSIEKMLLDTEIVKSRNAVIQPCASIFSFSALGYTPYDSPTTNVLFDLHNNFLQPRNIPYELVPDEMVLDKMAALDDFDCIILPYAPYMNIDFSRKLMKWVERGGTLIAFGPFAMFDEAGIALPGDDSLLKKLYPNSRIGAKLWDFSVSGQDETPAVYQKAFGRGKLVMFNREPNIYMQNAGLKAQLGDIFSQYLAKPVNCADENIRSICRRGKDGSNWLAVSNSSVTKPMQTKITVNGEFKRIYDVNIPGWMPLKTVIVNNKTECNIALRPGDWTVLKLE